MAKSLSLWNIHKKNTSLLYIAAACFSKKAFQSQGPANSATDCIFNNVKSLSKQGQVKKALVALHIINQQGIQPDSFTYAFLLQGCIDTTSLPEGKQVHAHIILTGFNLDTYLGTKLLIMYGKCGSLEDTCQVFDKMTERNAVSWNMMISAYFWHGHSLEAMQMFKAMKNTGLRADKFTFASVLPACAKLGEVKQGREVHGGIIRGGFESDVFVGNALVDMYAKCGSPEDARDMFDKMPERDVVSWSALIAGYAQIGHFDAALGFFKEMVLVGLEPNRVTFAAVLSTCANLVVLREGKGIHQQVVRSGFGCDVVVGNALVDMYAKCGRIDDARKVFDKMPERVVVSWNSMIVGYAIHGCGREAVQLFEQMCFSGTEPDHVTFLCVLSACCHAGLVDDGWRFFECMSRDYGIVPRVEHYGCVVDLLGRAGRLEDAQDLIKKMPIEPGAAVWRSLLGACRVYNNTQVAEHAAKRLFESDPEYAGHYVLLSNIYAAAGRWDDVENVRKLMKGRKIKKEPGRTWIEVSKRVYGFSVGDREYPQKEKIFAFLEKLSGQMKAAGYVPDTNFALHDVEDEQKEHILSHHSEKLAIAFGIINTPPGTPICIVKNLRVCGDCHSATKFISKIVGREISVRDANRYHHFKHGRCSCADYW